MLNVSRHMERTTNQAIERHYFEQFRLCYSLPAGEIVYSDKPDVLVKGQRLIGIEIANLYIKDGTDSSSEQVQFARREAAMRLAQQTHFDAGGKRLEFWFDFDPSHPILDAKVTAKALAAMAMRVQTDNGRLLFPNQLPEHDAHPVPELRSLYHSGAEYSNAKWRSMQSYVVPSLSLERLRAVVSEKTKKVGGYQKCDAYWLLLVVDFMNFAQDQDIEWPVESVFGTTPFEEIFLFKPQFAKVTRVTQ